MKTPRNSDEQKPADEADAIRIHRMLLEDLDSEEFHRLEQDLLASPSLRERCMRAIRIDMTLRDYHLESEESPPVVKGSRWLQFSSVVTAIAAVLILAAVLVWRTAPAKVGSQAARDVGVATLVDARDCKWAGDETIAVDQRISPSTLELASGVALIQFDGGAKLALEGPAKLEIIGTKNARLHLGNATVRCDQGIYSFSLLTPTSSIVDLGTEFGVAVDSEGASEVHVLDGAVEVVDTVSKFEPSVRLLDLGQTLALASNGTEKIITDTTQTWIRDYSTPRERKAEVLVPRVIARDSFPTNLSQPNRFALGSGWDGGWWLASKKSGDYHFVPSAPLIKRDGSSGLAMLVGWGEARRKLAKPIDPTVPQVVYVGLSMHRMVAEPATDNGGLSEATFMLRSSEDPTTVLAMGLSKLNYWVVAEQGGWERSDLPEIGSGPHFMVAKIEFSPLGGNQVSIKTFANSQEVSAQEPATWDMVTQRRHTQVTAPFDTIALRVRQSPFKFGELSIGNSWQAVVNPSAAGF